MRLPQRQTAIVNVYTCIVVLKVPINIRKIVDINLGYLQKLVATSCLCNCRLSSEHMYNRICQNCIYRTNKH